MTDSMVNEPMQRRDVLNRLLGAVAGSCALGLAPRQARATELVTALAGSSICLAPPPAPAGAHLPVNRLVYEGTHILAYGALTGIAKHYRGPLPLVIHGGGCDNAVLAVSQMTADVGGICCRASGPGFEQFRALTVARDIKVMVVHPTNPLADLPFDAIRAIGTGQVVRWSDLRRPGLPTLPGLVALVVRLHCPDHDEPVRGFFIGPHGKWSPRLLTVSDEQQLVDTVAHFPGGIAMASWVFAKPLVERGRLKMLSIDGAYPTPHSIRRGQYRLTAPLDMIYLNWRPELMAPLFDFIYSPQGRHVVGRRLLPVTAREARYPPVA
jgi:phosphate transport system substrate-binding protein